MGRPDEAIDALRSARVRGELEPAAQAFLALALADAGRPGAALRAALVALAPHLMWYGDAIARYADELGGD
ncbi:tetratricopeptide repeat protein [Demequina capsici]|uniref:tetratricopeptide repeat protein n=1 Tax=Demequina capsici TaxID=3075620 RepID=UPI0034D966A4